MDNTDSPIWDLLDPQNHISLDSDWRWLSTETALARWDGGFDIPVVLLTAGNDAHFEHTTHMLVMEILRDWLQHPELLPLEDANGQIPHAKWADFGMLAISRVLSSLSGAAVAAAKSYAYRILRSDYGSVLHKAQLDVPSRVVLMNRVTIPTLP